MTGDAVWYEAAFVVGVTNALNVVADGLGGNRLLAPVEESTADPAVKSLYADIRAFYAAASNGEATPLPFRLLARAPAYARDVWEAVKRAFVDNRLSRRHKESLAFAVSLTSRSGWGTTFHLDEMRRLGVSDEGVMEVLGVTQMFSSYTKIADMLRLEPDMGDIAPADPTPAPGGRPRS